MSNTVTIGKVYSPDNKRLIVEGTVNGVSVVGEGFTSRLATAKSEAHKTRYMQELLLHAQVPSAAQLKALKHSWLKHVLARPFLWTWANAPVLIVNAVITYLLIHFAR